MAAKARQKTRRWAARHLRDPYVRRSHQQGLRSRAAFKLEEIDRRDYLLRPAQRVVELGAAPGGWTQYLARHAGPASVLVAVDVLPMAALDGVCFIQGDVTDPHCQAAVRGALGGQFADLVISDMAPNISGVASLDDARFEALLDAALAFCETGLRPGGDLLIKVFQGAAADRFRVECRQRFARVAARKPAASRAVSREQYLLARGFGRRAVGAR